MNAQEPLMERTRFILEKYAPQAGYTVRPNNNNSSNIVCKYADGRSRPFVAIDIYGGSRGPQGAPKELMGSQLRIYINQDSPEYDAFLRIQEMTHKSASRTKRPNFSFYVLEEHIDRVLSELACARIK